MVRGMILGQAGWFTKCPSDACLVWNVKNVGRANEKGPLRNAQRPFDLFVAKITLRLTLLLPLGQVLRHHQIRQQRCRYRQRVLKSQTQLQLLLRRQVLE